MIAQAEKLAIYEGVWDVPPEVYHSDTDTLRNSAISVYLRSVVEFRERFISRTMDARDRPHGKAAVLRVGTAQHAMTLQPYEDLIAVCPKVDRRTKQGKADWYDFLEASEGKTVVSVEEYDLMLGMSKSLRSHSLAGPLLAEPGVCEQAIRWLDPETGLWCRALLDKRIDSKRIIVDLKTATDPLPGSFSRSVANYGYHRQQAFYCAGVKQVFGVEYDFYFVVVGSSPPHEVVVYRLDHEAVELGRKQAWAAMREIADRREKNNWTSRYDDTVVSLSLPRWEFTKEENQ